MNALLLAQRNRNSEAQPAFDDDRNEFDFESKSNNVDECNESERHNAISAVDAKSNRICSSSTDPVHELFGDDALRLINPFLRLASPPSSSEFDCMMANHRFRSARPGGANHIRALETIAHFCFRRGGPWRELGVELNSRVSR